MRLIRQILFRSAGHSTLLGEAYLLWRRTHYSFCLNLVCSGPFICDSVSSLCPLCNATSVAWGPTHPSPFSVSSSDSTTVGVFTQVEDGGQRRDGILHHAKSHPSTTMTKLRVYDQFNWIRLHVCSGLIRTKPNTPWAIKGIGWVIATRSFSAKANTSITLHLYKLYKSKRDDKEEI